MIVYDLRNPDVEIRLVIRTMLEVQLSPPVVSPGTVAVIEPKVRIELTTPSIPKMYSATELHRLIFCNKWKAFPAFPCPTLLFLL